MENNQYTERIHSYLLGKMSEEEKSKFEQEAAADAELQNALKLEQKMLAALQLAGDEALRQSIVGAEKRLEEQRFFAEGKVVNLNATKTSKILAMKNVVAIAAGVVALVGLAWWGFLKPSAPDTNQLFADNFKPETTVVKDVVSALAKNGLIDSSLTAQDTLRDALLLYDAGKYNEACTALDSFLVRHPANDTAQFYLGMGHLNAERFARAVEVLEPVSKAEGSAFRLDAMWYLGLCYFKVEDGFQKAEELFQELASNAEFRDQQAAQGILRLIGH